MVYWLIIPSACKYTKIFLITHAVYTIFIYFHLFLCNSVSFFCYAFVNFE